MDEQQRRRVGYVFEEGRVGVVVQGDKVVIRLFRPLQILIDGLPVGGLDGIDAEVAEPERRQCRTRLIEKLAWRARPFQQRDESSVAYPWRSQQSKPIAQIVGVNDFSCQVGVMEREAFYRTGAQNVWICVASTPSSPRSLPRGGLLPLMRRLHGI